MEKKEFLTTITGNLKTESHTTIPDITTRDLIADQTHILPILQKNLITDMMAPPTDQETNTKIEEGIMIETIEKKKLTSLPITTRMMAIREDLKTIGDLRMKENIIDRVQKNVMGRKNTIMMDITEENKVINIVINQDNITATATTIVDEVTKKKVTEKMIVKGLQNATKKATIEAVTRKIMKENTMTETTEGTNTGEMITESITGTGKILLIIAGKLKIKGSGHLTATEATAQITKNDSKFSSNILQK